MTENDLIKTTTMDQASKDILGPMNEMTASLTRRIEQIPEIEKILRKAANSTGFSGENIVQLFLAAVLSLLFFLSGMTLIITGVAWVYPLYRSIQAVSHKKEDQERWLMYWIVYGLVGSFFHTIGDTLLFWVPMYEPLKIVVYLVLWHPAIGGAEKVFENCISPYLN